MKKLYVLVFLIMFMGNMFSSDTAIFKNKDGQYSFSILIPDTEVGRAITSDRIIIDNIPTKFVGGYKFIRNAEKGPIERGINEQSGFEIDNKAKFDEIIAKQFIDIITLQDFVRSATSLKEYKIKKINFSDNPWDTLAPKAFAEGTGLTESDLKTSVFRDIGKTTEQKFILNLQKQLIKKLETQLNDSEAVSKILGILKRLPAGIVKRPDELQKDLSAVLTKAQLKGKIDMNVQSQINGFSLRLTKLSFNPKYQPSTVPEPSTVPAQTQSTVDPRTEQASSQIGPIEKARKISRMTGSTITVYIEPKTAQGSIIQSKQSTQPAKLASFRAQSPQRTQQAQAKAPTIIRTGSLKR